MASSPWICQALLTSLKLLVDWLKTYVNWKSKFGKSVNFAGGRVNTERMCYFVKSFMIMHCLPLYSNASCLQKKLTDFSRQKYCIKHFFVFALIGFYRAVWEQWLPVYQQSSTLSTIQYMFWAIYNDTKYIIDSTLFTILANIYVMLSYVYKK